MKADEQPEAAASADERLRRLADRFGTPLYAYDGVKIETQYRTLKDCLPSGFEVFYSVKCNPLLGVCQLLHRLGSSVEVASEGELAVALQAGVPAGSIIWTSPGKTRRELELAIDRRIASINVESVEEAQLISRLAAERGVEVPVAVRINPDFHPAGAGLKMTGVPTPFGIEQEQAADALRQIAALPHVRLNGLHIFTGSQVLDAAVLVQTMERIIELALALTEETGLKLAFLDLGGGFGIPYFPGEKPLDTAYLKRELAVLWDRLGHRLAGVRVAVESGRFLLAESGTYLTRVEYVKTCRGTKFLVCDGGSHQHAASAFLGRYVRNNFPMRLIPAGGTDAPPEEVHVVGPLCTPTDVIGQKVRLAPAKPGDLVAVEQSGAYGLTHSPAMFLSHPLPAEVLAFPGKDELLRERGNADDFLAGQQPLGDREPVWSIGD
ncbi:type III PLP-dependent enzyme [Gorillibacterium sp. sgz500922]|uniref:type III PLP-dependent enzyme n=1 Tax=Gorillibacterium sp. sgz500922 TaxID=3446694 RepID=UPI003F6639F2